MLSAKTMFRRWKPVVLFAALHSYACLGEDPDAAPSNANVGIDAGTSDATSNAADATSNAADATSNDDDAVTDAASTDADAADGSANGDSGSQNPGTQDSGVACPSNSNPNDTTDVDSDGYSVAEGDCNDCNDKIKPGAGCP